MIFTKEESLRFEVIWLEKNKNVKDVVRDLGNDDYINYHIWQDINCEEMYKKHLPHVTLVRGKNPNIIFHGGCLGCKSQRIHGIDRCRGCMYFKFDFRNKPNLFIPGEDSATIDDFKNLLK